MAVGLWLLLGVSPAAGDPVVHAEEPAGAAAGAWVLPLDGDPVVTRPFDPPATPYGPGHRGVDLAGRPDQVVRAAGAGTIGFAAPLAGRGVITVLHDGGLRTTYEPVQATVVVGQAVDAGDPIGTLQAGHAGCPVSACLHWGLKRGEVYLDPMSLLGLGPLRLLPSADPKEVTSSGAAAPDGDPSTLAAHDGSRPAAGGLPLAATAVLGLGLGLVVLTVGSRVPP